MSSYDPDGVATLVYDHSSWSGYLLQRLLPRAARVPAQRGDGSGEILATVTADIGVFIFHIDLTRADGLPSDRGELTAHLGRLGVKVINHEVVDISKRALQRACADLGLPTTISEKSGPPDGLVIVKTDRNYGGVPEVLSRERDSGREAGPGEGAPEPAEYVVARRRDIGEEVWTRSDLIVENYVSNKYRQIFRAIRLDGSTAFMAHRIERQVDRVPADSSLVVEAGLVPEVVKKTVEDLAGHHGIDFGAFDVIVDDAGRAYVIDFNSTPYWGAGELGALRELVRPPYS